MGRGIKVNPLDRKKKWQFKPLAEVGSDVSAGDIVGEVRETSMVNHKIMVPPDLNGKLLELHEGDFTIDDEIGTIKVNGGKKALKLMQDWPVRIPIQDVFSITGVGTVPIGRVETGTLKLKDIVVFEPSKVGGEVRSIEMHHEQIQRAVPGDNIGFSVRGVSKEQIKRGDVVGHQDKPPTVTTEFTAKIIVLAIPTEIAPGFMPMFHCHASNVPGRIVEILQKVDPRTGAVVEEKPKSLRKGDVGVIRVSLVKPMVIERANGIPELSRFAVRHGGQTIAAGMCIDLVELKRDQ